MDKTGKIWGFMPNGAARTSANDDVEGLSSEGYKVGGAANDILEFSDGTYWVASETGVHEFDGATWKQILADVGIVRALVKRRDGCVWAATDTGLYRHRNGYWIANTREDGLPSSDIYTLFEDSHGQMWVGTGAGLSVFHPEADPDPPRAAIPQEDNLYNLEIDSDKSCQFRFSGIDKWKYTSTDRLLFSLTTHWTIMRPVNITWAISPKPIQANPMGEVMFRNA